ncbi:MAG: nicotinate phosphoribosyltransferase [Halobacteriaceae archaeon]
MTDDESGTPPFEMVEPATIAAGDATDAYFDRTIETLAAADRDPTVVAEVTADQFPTGEFDLFAGLPDAAHLLEGLPVDVDALPEGTLFDGGPVLRIEGPYRAFCRYETALLGFLSQASAMATAALEARRAAPAASLHSFGSRHVHPAIAPVVERSALIAGFDGFSNTAAEPFLDREAGGTMPHSLVIVFGRGNQAEAWRAFDAAVDEAVPRIALVDTYADEVEESLRAIEALGEDLESVRIDTTGSRRGDIVHIVREVKWELRARGREDVDVFVSGGITPDSLRALRDVADGFGVGSHITDADPLDFALDIVSVAGEPAAKRGKLSGAKQVYRTPEGGHEIALADHDTSPEGEPLLEPVLRDGDIVREFDVDAAADRAERDGAHVLGDPA